MESALVIVCKLVAWLIIQLLEGMLWVNDHSFECLVAGLMAGFCYLVVPRVLLIRVGLHPATVQTYHDIIARFGEETRLCERVEDVTVPVGEEDSDLFQDPVCKDLKQVRSSRRIPYAVRVAHLAKAQVGLLANTRANELVYARICREEMVKHGVRPSHIAHLVPIAVAAAFIPLDSDFLAASIRRCSQMKERTRQVGSGASH